MNRYLHVFLFALISFELLGQSGRSPVKEVNISKTPARIGPANLEISDVAFSDQYGNSNSVLDANEEAEISFTLSNRRQRQCSCTCCRCHPVKPDEGH